MLFKNAVIFTPSGFISGYFRVQDGIFTEITHGEADEDGIDLQGAMVLPGLVDIHIHGYNGIDFSLCEKGALEAASHALAIQGVTSFVPTLMSFPSETLYKACRSLYDQSLKNGTGCSRIVGIRAEGPFLSKAKKGSHNEKYLQIADPDVFETLYEKSGFLLRVIDIAPEIPGAALVARKASPYCRVSAAHTEASYDEASAFFNAGGRHVTHLFNAMSPMLARSPGMIAAASERERITAEVICDGIHVHPSMIRVAFKLFPGRLCLVSDALSCSGMPDGKYELDGQIILKQKSCARLEDGTIAGAVTGLWADMKNAISFGIIPEEAILAATLIPAKIIGAASRIGSIEVGKNADFVICSREYEQTDVYINGVRV